MCYKESELIERILFRCYYSIKIWDWCVMNSFISSSITSVSRRHERIWLSQTKKVVKFTLGKLAIRAYGVLEINNSLILQTLVLVE